jgi:hypothetical protein
MKKRSPHFKILKLFDEAKSNAKCKNGSVWFLLLIRVSRLMNEHLVYQKIMMSWSILNWWWTLEINYNSFSGVPIGFFNHPIPLNVKVIDPQTKGYSIWNISLPHTFHSIHVHFYHMLRMPNFIPYGLSKVHPLSKGGFCFRELAVMSNLVILLKWWYQP